MIMLRGVSKLAVVVFLAVAIILAGLAIYLSGGKLPAVHLAGLMARTPALAVSPIPDQPSDTITGKLTQAHNGTMSLTEPNGTSHAVSSQFYKLPAYAGLTVKAEGQKISGVWNVTYLEVGER